MRYYFFLFLSPSKWLRRFLSRQKSSENSLFSFVHVLLFVLLFCCPFSRGCFSLRQPSRPARPMSRAAKTSLLCPLSLGLAPSPASKAGWEPFSCLYSETKLWHKNVSITTPPTLSRNRRRLNIFLSLRTSEQDFVASKMPLSQPIATPAITVVIHRRIYLTT